MKKVQVLVALSFLFMQLKSQGLIFHSNMGYTFDCTFDAFEDTSNYYSATVQQGFRYTLDGGYQIDKNFSVNLSLQYQNTNLVVDARYNGNKLSPDLQMALLWVQVGGTSHLPAKPLEFFFGTYVGVGIYNFSQLPSNNQSAPVRLSWSFRGGFVFFITKGVGINFRTDALFSLDPLNKEFIPPSLMDNEKGYNSFFQYSISSGITIRLFGSAGRPKKQG